MQSTNGKANTDMGNDRSVPLLFVSTPAGIALGTDRASSNLPNGSGHKRAMHGDGPPSGSDSPAQPVLMNMIEGMNKNP